MKKEIFMGLDPGTESVGWAVTNQNYELVKKNGKSLWGVYMFDEAESQKERRAHRSNFRRMKRRKERIALLQHLFEEEMNKADPYFFKKMNSSFCKLEDRDSQLKYNLFADENFTDKNFYDLYPTIYHLRKYLLETDDKVDIRLIYLALHHMVKYRGHFTFEGQTFDVKNIDIMTNFIELNDLISDELSKFKLANINNNDLINIFISNKGITKTKEDLCNLLGVKKEKNLVSIISLLCGGTVKICDLYENDEYKELEKLSFSSSKFDELLPTLESALEDDIEIIYKTKSIYDSIVLKRLLGENKYLSYAMVDKYNKHAEDLRKLKEYVIKNNKNLYNDIFRNVSQQNNYPNYIGSNLVDNVKSTLSHTKIEDFYSFLKKKLGIIPNNNEYFDSILLDMENNNYLPRLNTTDNGVFPYQLNENEMKLILYKQSKYYHFLLDEDEFGSNIDKILSILTFRIPYYIGPLNNNSKFAWIVRKNEKILPWNFNKIVDIDKSSQEFINRMKNHCTYLYDCNTLPKHSLIYSKFELLEELNKININGYPISYNDKKILIDELFLKQKKVTIKQIKTFFESLYGKGVLITTSNNKELEEIKSSLSSWIIFKNIFKDEFEKNIDMIENIIEEITIFKDKDILYRRLNQIYNLPMDMCKVIKGLSFKDYGRLSKELLTGLKTPIVDNLGEVHEKCIMDILEETNMNFIEIIYSSNYSFKDTLDKYNVKNEQVNYQLIDNLPLSPAVKRGIWSTIKIVDEVEQILGKPVDKFFIESTRENGKKNEKIPSRKKKIMGLYKAVDKALKEFDLLSKEEYKELKNSLEIYNDRSLRAKKLYLYFMQLGRCMYSNEPINISLLFSDYYDIDHIVPRSVVKDDSFDNLVLVKSELNRQKRDIYPITSNIISDSAKVLWKFLKNNKLINENKYNKLTRRNELTPEELIHFINRQLVFTNQTVKVIANLLKMRNENCKVIWSKASNVSDFREKFDIPKCRDINDLHHAHDAYLNIVVGNVFNSKFGYEMNIMRYNQFKNDNISMKPDRIYEYPIKYVADQMAWVPNETIKLVKKELAKVEVLTSYMMTKNKGKFYKSTIYAPEENKKLIPLKEKGLLSDYTKYGGYDNVEFSHFCIVKHIKKGKEQYLFAAIPILMSKESMEKRINYIAEKYGVTNPVIILDDIRKNMIIVQNGFEYRIRGEKDRVINVQSYWSNDKVKYLKQVIKTTELDIPEDAEEYLLHKSKDKISLISKKLNLELYQMIINKFTNKPFDSCVSLKKLGDILNDKKDLFISLSLKNQCVVIKNLMDIQLCKPSRSDLSLIDGSKDTGRITMSNNLPLGTKIITKSVTGYYSKVLFEI